MELKLKTNLDTNFLKIIACISMVIDHAGSVFFPSYIMFRWIGRLAFPIFCYCLTVGMLYTHNVYKYLLRLGVFAIISQPFYILAFHPNDFFNNLFILNIFFTLFISLLAVWGFKEKKCFVFIIATTITALVNFDYSLNGIILMLIFYLCRNKPKLGVLLFILNYLPILFTTPITDPHALVIGNYAIGFECFSVFAIPFIFLKTSTNLKLSKWIFYVFYPLHLFVIYVFRMIFI